ncbi:MAG: enoyl-CoA hydratase/isomerase family protein [Deltaproteobacteria bacterium]|nr:enoyl-CoA hydratase/isomerase family protein [Deltaproteobacteria bacterium]MBW2070310.1 enoyl-CoA hydratase/isomerase family protein [Deltaproteobacteria bacterium]
MAEQILLVEDRAAVRILTLNRPQVRNALNLQLLVQLEKAVHETFFSDNIRVLLITGAGSKAFCAGADLKERASMTESQVRRFLFTIRKLLQAVEELPIPVIAAINGTALGGGTELALACDLRLAAASATLGLTETRLAIIPGAGGTQRLPRLVGVAAAKELIFTGKVISAREAYSLGLLNRVVEQESLMQTCLELAEEMCQAGPIALAQAKFAINKGMSVDLHSGLAIEASAYERCIPTEDRLEGLAAFAEKRQPIYRGR